MMSHDKSHVSPDCGHLDLTNAVVPLTVLSDSCDASAIINALHGQTSHITPPFNHL